MTSTNPVVANAMAVRNEAVGVNAGNMKSKKFGDVEAREFGGDRPSWEIGMNLNGLVSAYSVRSKEDCIAQANALIDALKRKAGECAKAIQWMKSNG